MKLTPTAAFWLGVICGVPVGAIIAAVAVLAELQS